MRDLDKEEFFIEARIEARKAGVSVSDAEIEIGWKQWNKLLASGDLSEEALEAHGEAACQAIKAARGINMPPRN